MVDCHLQNLRLLQLGRALLLEGRRHETPQLREGVVDAVTTPLLDDAATPLAGHAAAGGAVIAAAENGGKRRLISVSEMLREGGRAWRRDPGFKLVQNALNVCHIVSHID